MGPVKLLCRTTNITCVSKKKTCDFQSLKKGKRQKESIPPDHSRPWFTSYECLLSSCELPFGVVVTLYAAGQCRRMIRTIQSPVLYEKSESWNIGIVPIFHMKFWNSSHISWPFWAWNIRIAMKYWNYFSFLTHKVYNSQKSPFEQKNIFDSCQNLVHVLFLFSNLWPFWTQIS